jgi:hypothetical protein
VSGKLSHDTNSNLEEISYEISYLNDNIAESVIIDPANVAECQLVWDVSDISVLGSIVFTDVNDVFALLPITANMTITIKAKQSLSNKANNRYDINKTFVICKLEKNVKGLAKVAIRIEFCDMHFYYFSNLYKSKGYKNITLGEIITDVLTNAKIGTGTITKPNIFFNSNAVKKHTMVIPGNKSFLNFLYNAEYVFNANIVNNRGGLSVYNTTDYISILKANSYDKYITLTSDPNDNSPFYIKDFKVMDLDAYTYNSVMPITGVSTFDYSNKGAFLKIVSPDAISAGLSLGKDKLRPLGSTIGFKHVESGISNFDNVVRKLYSFKLIENTLIEVVVSGNFVFDLYRAIDVKMGNTISDITTYNTAQSGTYVILKIVDKFQNGFFNQIITLGRAGISYPVASK